MKLATLKDGTRDGQLVVVSRDLRTAAIADAIVPTLQRALDDWTFYAPQLLDLTRSLSTPKPAWRRFPARSSGPTAPLM
jgi:fumarylacetoacetate (FAA) hydrolase